MSIAELSPTVAAAVARNPKLAKVVRAMDLVNSPFDPPPLGGPALVELPPDLSVHELDGSDADGGPKKAPDAIDVALRRIDLLDERQRRYRAATGRARRLMEPGEPLTIKIEPSLKAQVDELAMQRGSTRSETMRWLLGCGLILADERRRRYEAFMIRQMEDVRGVGIDPLLGEYIDPESSSLPAAMAEAADVAYDTPDALREMARAMAARPLNPAPVPTSAPSEPKAPKELPRPGPARMII